MNKSASTTFEYLIEKYAHIVEGLEQKNLSELYKDVLKWRELTKKVFAAMKPHKGNLGDFGQDVIHYFVEYDPSVALQLMARTISVAPGYSSDKVLSFILALKEKHGLDQKQVHAFVKALETAKIGLLESPIIHELILRKEDGFSAAQWLFQNGFKAVNDIGPGRDTVLHRIAYRTTPGRSKRNLVHKDMLGLLIKKGADINAQSEVGFSVLELALISRNFPVAKKLLEQPAITITLNVGTKNITEKPLAEFYANMISKDDFDFVYKKLMDAGAIDKKPSLESPSTSTNQQTQTLPGSNGQKTTFSKEKMALIAGVTLLSSAIVYRLYNWYKRRKEQQKKEKEQQRRLAQLQPEIATE